VAANAVRARCTEGNRLEGVGTREGADANCGPVAEAVEAEFYRDVVGVKIKKFISSD
jgi:hypothetical protein